MKRILAAMLLALVAGCSKKPDNRAIVLWEQPAPQVAAQAHAREINGFAIEVSGKSMEPLIVAGDWIVVDLAFPFEKIEGHVANYVPDSANLARYPGLNPGQSITHVAAAKHGTGYIMDGVNNPHYERDALTMERRNYVGRVVQVYTKRPKP